MDECMPGYTAAWDRMRNAKTPLERIAAHQANPYVHPLTCGMDSGHENLEGFELEGQVHLRCPTCGWVQSSLPPSIG